MCARLWRATGPFLDVPPAGQTITLPPQAPLKVVVRYLGPETPTAVVLYWQGEGPAAGIQGQVPMALQPRGNGVTEARLPAWPLQPLLPGTYRLWAEAQGVPAAYARSQAAQVRLLSPQAVATLRAPGRVVALPPVSPTPAPAWPRYAMTHVRINLAGRVVDESDLRPFPVCTGFFFAGDCGITSSTLSKKGCRPE